MGNTDFEKFGLRPELVRALERREFIELTPVQKEVMQLDRHDTDLIVRAKTGSGKTLAFLLPLFNEYSPEDFMPGILVLSPTRELAQQIARESQWIGKNLNIQTAVLVGGMDMSPQIKDLRRGAAMVVGTPGRTLDHLRRGTLKLDNVHTVILDEGDQMLDMGFRDELEAILDGAAGRERTWLFSATMPQEVRRLANRYLSDPGYISLVEEGEQHSEIAHKVYLVPHSRKLDGLVNVLLWENPSKGLVFCHTRAETMDVAQRLNREGLNAASLHGDMTQRERNSALASFRSGRTSLLVATNVAARGLDVPEIEQVLQFGLPDDLETFTHRSGRTGRAGNEGENIVVLDPREAGRFRGMIRRTNIATTWLDVPDGSAILEKRRAVRKEDLLLRIDGDVNTDLRDWARDLLENAEPEDLVAGLLEAIDGDIPRGYDLTEKLKQEKAHSRTRPTERKSGPRRQAEKSSDGQDVMVRLSLGGCGEWSVGRVLSGICGALAVDGSEITKIRLHEGSVQVGLMPEALKKYHQKSDNLEKRGLAPVAVEGPVRRNSFKGKPNRDKKPNSRRDRQKAY